MKKYLIWILCLCLINTGRAQLSSVINKFPEAKCVQCDYAEIDPTFNWGAPKTNPSTATKYSMVTGPAGATYGNVNSTPTSLARVLGGSSGYPATLFGNHAYRYKLNNTGNSNTRTELYWGVGGGDVSGAEWFMAGIFVPTSVCMDQRPFGLGFDMKHANAIGPANINIKVQNGIWQLNFDYPQGAGERKWNLGSVEKGKWTYILINRNYTDEQGSNPAGFVKVYMWTQGTTPVFTLKQTITGPNYNMQGARQEGYVLWGPYIWGASGNEGSGPCDASGFTMAPSYEFFYDNIIIAKPTATLTDFNNFISGASAPSNQAPTVDAGPNQSITLPTSSVALNGTVSDADGNIEGRIWTQLPGGPNTATFSNAGIDDPTVTGLIAGTYTFRLTATDDDGASSSDEVVITVNASGGTTSGPRFTVSTCADGNYLSNGCPSTPIPDRAITSPATTDTAIFYAVHGDTTGYVQSFSVAQISAPGGTSPAWNQYLPQDGYWIYTPGGFAFSGLTANGTYTFEVTVTDGQSRTKKDTFNIVRTSTGNTLPTINAGSDINLYIDNVGPFTNTSTTLNGTGSDADGTISSFLWSRVSGPDNIAFSTPTNDTTAVTMLSAGAYLFRLSGIDNSGGSAYDDVIVNVITANAGSDTVIVNPANSAPLTGINVGGTVTSVLWTQTSGTGGSITNSTSLNATAANLSVGTYTYQLEITFSNGSKARDIKQIVVAQASTTIDYRVIRQ